MMESNLKAGTTLIVDCYSYSGVAFSSAKGVDLEWCKAPKIGLLVLDLVLHLDMPPEVSCLHNYVYVRIMNANIKNFSLLHKCQLQLARHPCSELYIALTDYCTHS